MLSDADLTNENLQCTSHYDAWYAIVLSSLFWGLSYQVALKALPLKNKEYCCRIIAAIHGATSAFFGINQCFLIDWPFDHPEWRTTNLQKFLMLTSLGYFIYDLIWCLMYQRDSKLMLAHHVYSVFALHQMLQKEYSGAQATCALGSMELTNPMLQLRWFLRSEGYYPSALFTSVEITFVIIFFLVRIVLGTYFIIIIAMQPKNALEFKVLSAVIYIISWMFMVNIIKYFLNKYSIIKLKIDGVNNNNNKIE